MRDLISYGGWGIPADVGQCRGENEAQKSGLVGKEFRRTWVEFCQ